MHFKSPVFILIFLFNFSLMAGSFLGDLSIKGEVVGFDDLFDQIEKNSKIPRSFVSIGETHLHSKSMTSLHLSLFKKYASKVKKLNFCSEEINNFLKNDEVAEFLNSDKVFSKKIYDLSISTSDMPNCFDKSKYYRRYLVYSGIYHQYPFARNYSELPRQTDVIRSDVKNIAYQVRHQTGVFISSIELDYLINNSIIRVFQERPDNIIDLKNSLISIKEDVLALQSKMQKVLDGTRLNIDDKNGVLLKTSNFALSNFEGKHSHYFFITDFNFRNIESSSSFYTINHLLNLNNDQLENLRVFLNNSRAAVFTGFYLEPKADLSFPTFNFNNGHLFHGDFTYLQIFSSTNPGIVVVFENLPGATARVLIPSPNKVYIELPEGMDYFKTLNEITPDKKEVQVKEDLVI